MLRYKTKTRPGLVANSNIKLQSEITNRSSGVDRRTKAMRETTHIHVKYNSSNN